MANAEHPASDAVRAFARLGYFARGTVYLTLAVVTALAAFGATQPESSEGALRTVYSMPLGTVLLVALFAGLVAFGGWRVCQSVFDADNHGRNLRAVVVRIGLGSSALLHFGLALAALTLLLDWNPGGGGGGGQSTQEDWTAWLLDQPYGLWLTYGLAACIFGAGIAISYKGYDAGFRKWMKLEHKPVRLLSPVCQVGLVTRGLISLGVGVFLAQAAWRSNAGEVAGLKEMLEMLQAQVYGAWLLAAASVGLLSFAVYSFVESVYREIQGLDEW